MVERNVYIMEKFFDTIKTYASKAKDETTKVAKHVWGKTNDLVDQTKISVAISETERKIDDIYKEIGAIVCENYNSGEEYGTQINECCEKVDSLKEEIASLQKELAKLKSGVQCACGQYNNKDAVYCSSCGEKIEKEFETPDEQVVIIKPTREE